MVHYTMQMTSQPDKKLHFKETSPGGGVPSYYSMFSVILFLPTRRPGSTAKMSRTRLLCLVAAVSTQLVSAHPTRGVSSRADKTGPLLDTYHFNTVSTYTTLDQDKHVSSTAGVKRDHDADADKDVNSAVPYYVQAATSQVRKVVPGSNFRIVDDYYVGANNVGHVHFQQIIDGIDVDTAYFKVNVGFRDAPSCHTRSSIP